jgi:hypothetical protein
MKKKTKQQSKRIQKELKQFDKGVRRAQKEIDKIGIVIMDEVKRARAGLIPESDWTEEEKQAEEKTAKAIKKQPKKRILSVTIKRMIDDSPDTSWLGEYSNTPANEFAIDRAHAEDCASVQRFYSDGVWAAWNGEPSAMLERVRTFLESFEASVDHESSPNGCHEDCPACEEGQPYYDAISTIWELENVAGECDCHGGDMARGEYRYFNPSFNYVDKAGKPTDGLTPEEVRKYTRKDYERMERLNRGDWCYIGISAEAEIGLPRFGDSYLIERLQSGGLWGLESDAGDYLESVEQEQLADLKQVLKDLGFSSRAISQAFKNVERKDA